MANLCIAGTRPAIAECVEKKSFAGDRRHGDDAHMKAASEEEDKLLSTGIKSIRRGC
jgi:hypothetical protein